MADYNEEEKQRNPMTFSIDEIGFSGRTNNCLRRHGVKTIGELCNMTESEVKKIRNLGFNSLLEIKTKLAEYGLNLAKLESNKEGRTPIDDAPISNEEKEKITEKQNALKMTIDPTSKYYSAIVGGVLDAVKERGYELTNQNVTDIICKALDVASYQKWQEIKGENFGNNKLKVKTI